MIHIAAVEKVLVIITYRAGTGSSQGRPNFGGEAAQRGFAGGERVRGNSSRQRRRAEGFG